MITENTTFYEVYNTPSVMAARDSLMTSPEFFTEWNRDKSIKEVFTDNTPQCARDVVYGLNRLENGPYEVYKLYDGIKSKEKVSLIYLPAKEKKTDRFALLLAGGAYVCVCTLVESLPVSAKFNELGMDAFCLVYEVKEDEKHDKKPLFPRPFDDIAAALRFIRDELRLGEDYIIGGFSAGGHAASVWGTKSVGAEKYGLQKPAASLLCYPLITAEYYEDKDFQKFIAGVMHGSGFTTADMRAYDTSRLLDKDYPKTYLIRALDDVTVCKRDGDELTAALKKHGVPHFIDENPHGGHGFGLASHTDLSGYVERFVEFINS